MNTLLLRHGRSVHNGKTGLLHKFFKYGNDDILGLTRKGIKETAEMARELNELLSSDRVRPGGTVKFFSSPSIRARQTTSLLVTELVRSYKRVPSDVSIEYREELVEFPSDYFGSNAVPNDFAQREGNAFDYDAFLASIDYPFLGTTFRNEILKRRGMYRELYTPGVDTRIVVGHRASLAAMMCSYVCDRVGTDPTPDLIGCFLRLDIPHNHVIHLETFFDGNPDVFNIAKGNTQLS